MCIYIYIILCRSASVSSDTATSFCHSAPPKVHLHSANIKMPGKVPHIFTNGLYGSYIFLKLRLK